MANASKCSRTDKPIDCLRSMSIPLAGENANLNTYFSGYLPSVIDFIEKYYTAADANSLLIPSSGAVNYSIIKIRNLTSNFRRIIR